MRAEQSDCPTSATSGRSAAATTPHDAPDPQRPVQPRLALAIDIGLPLIAYYGLHAFGVADRTALIAAALAAGVRMVWDAVRRRHVSWFAAIMLGTFAAGAALTLTGGDPRTLLLKDSVGTALIGLAFLGSLVGRSPLALSAAQSWRPGVAERLAELHRTDPAARAVFRRTTLGWGVGLLGESALRVPLVYLIPVDVMVGLSTAMMIAAMAGLLVWNAAYVTAAARRSPQLRILLPGPPGRG